MPDIFFVLAFSVFANIIDVLGLYYIFFCYHQRKVWRMYVYLNCLKNWWHATNIIKNIALIQIHAIKLLLQQMMENKHVSQFSRKCLTHINAFILWNFMFVISNLFHNKIQTSTTKRVRIIMTTVHSTTKIIFMLNNNYKAKIIC